jgi:DNA-directed RNA polymerase specialized sigma24 family protein
VQLDLRSSRGPPAHGFRSTRRLLKIDLHECATSIAGSGRVAAVVYDAKAPSSERVVAELSKPEIRAKMYRLAPWSTHSEGDAEDLVQDALLRVLEPEDAPSEPERRGFLTHMSYVMRQVWDQRGRAARARLEIITDGLAVDEGTNEPESRIYFRRWPTRALSTWSAAAGPREVDAHRRSRTRRSDRMRGGQGPAPARTTWSAESG